MRLRGTRLGSVSAGQNLDPLWAAAGAIPSLDLRFAEGKNLFDYVSGQNLITFARASSGSYTDSNGVLQTAVNSTPRFDHNPQTGESLGLLVEEQRTNLVTSSATFQPSSGGNPASYTVDQVAPDGTTTASRQTAANPRTFIDYQGIANAQYTFSVYAKVASGTATISLVLKNATSDTEITVGSNVTLTTAWQRLTITGTTNGATTGARIEVIGPVIGAPAGTVFWGAQLEAGAFPTSYIPTTTAAVTRAADVPIITGSNFSSWYRQDEGTFYGECQTLMSASVPGLFTATDSGTINNRIDMRLPAQSFVSSGGSVVANLISGPALSAGILYRAALGVQADNFARTTNNSALASDTSGAMPVGINQIEIGNIESGTFKLNGHIRRLTYWPQRLPNSNLQSITI